MTTLADHADLPPVPSICEPETTGVSIEESGEPIVRLKDTSWLLVRPAYSKLGFRHAFHSVYVRASVAAKLKHASERLPSGIKFLVWDGLRTLQLQAEIADRFQTELKTRNCPDYEQKLLISQYVSPLPETLTDFWCNPPAHTTGGAIDLSLADQNGNPLELGTDFDEFGERARPDWFENQPRSARSQECHLRRLLRHVLTSVGGVQYHAEWWHFEFGTVRAAACRGGKVARYGPVVPSDGLIKPN